MSVLAVILEAARNHVFAGRGLAEHAISIVAMVRPVDRIVVVGGAGLAAVVDGTPGITAIEAPVTDRMAALSKALAHLEEDEGYAADLALLIDPAFPLLTPGLIEDAVDHLRRCGADALLSVHAATGRLWIEDEEGGAAPLASASDRLCYVENGALGIVRVGVFQHTEMLPAGRTVLFPIPMAMALQPGGEGDWSAAEAIFRSTTEAQARARLKGVRLVCFDFDGVMTDNRVLVLEDGTEGVLCNRSDGLGLERMMAAGVSSAVISKERNPVVAARCRKLRIPCQQGIDDKLKVLRDLAADQGFTLADVAYMGNDLNDLECMRAVGVAVAPADAYAEVLAVAHLVTRKAGGFGAVRELCDLILVARTKAS
ncbi:MAG: HAD hydrolase family protein [Rhodospirillales bacterium]